MRFPNKIRHLLVIVRIGTNLTMPSVSLIVRNLYCIRSIQLLFILCGEILISIYGVTHAILFFGKFKHVFTMVLLGDRIPIFSLTQR